MKKFFTVITLTFLVTILCCSFTACNFITISEKDAGSNNTPYTETILGEEVKTSDKYEKRYGIKDLSFATNDTATEKSAEEIISEIYSSVVTIKCPISNGYQIGSGIITDINVEYTDSSLNTSNFVYVLTCHHVIEGSTKFVVYLPKLIDKDTGEYSFEDYAFGATLIGGDKENDVAVLRIEIQGYDDLSINDIVKAKISDKNLVRGESVMAIGNPGGDLPGWVSKGIVSNLFVKVNIDDIGEMTLIGTDTSINKGNSGGGLFNMKGELVGIINAGDTDKDGIGFAIPMTGENGALATATSLIKTSSQDSFGYIEGKWKLGASFKENLVGPNIHSTTVYISVFNIDENGSIGSAGIKDNDYVLEISYTYKNETLYCKMESMSEFKKFYDVMQKNLKNDDIIQVVVTSNTRQPGTKVDVTLKQYVYSI